MGERGAVMADTIGPAYDGDDIGGDGQEFDFRRSRNEPLPLGRLALLAGLLWFRRRAGKGRPPG